MSNVEKMRIYLKKDFEEELDRTNREQKSDIGMLVSIAKFIVMTEIDEAKKKGFIASAYIKLQSTITNATEALEEVEKMAKAAEMLEEATSTLS